jgi:serine/threonine protein kinase
MRPPSHVGRYELGDRLGEGGMGEVYLAHDPLLERTVAIKILSGYIDPQQGPEMRERFAREARSAAALRHNNIVIIYDFGEEEGSPFIAMEHLDGETMAEFIKRRPAVPVARKLQMMIGLCSGLAYAHRKGIIHRDIKPANLMITLDAGLKILDFGLARLAADMAKPGLTRVGVLMGTPYYMAPEQVEGKTLDVRSDIFSVGVVLYELLTYSKAFPGDNPHLVMHGILQKTPTPIRQLLPSIDSDLERIVGRGLEKDRALRYQNLDLLAADLQKVLDRLVEDSGHEVIAATAPHQPGRAESDRIPGSRTPTPRSGPPRIPNLDGLAQRRQAQIDAHLQAASEHLANQRYDDAVEQSEHALVLDPHEHRAMEMLELAHRRIEDSQVQRRLAEARSELSRGSLTGAESLIAEALRLRPDSADALQLQLELRDQRRERERSAERARGLRMALERARASLSEGAMDAALRSVREALTFEPGDQDALALEKQVETEFAQQRRQQALDDEARRTVARAREAADRQDFSGALSMLRSVLPPHPLVSAALTEIETSRAVFERRRAEEETAPFDPTVALQQQSEPEPQSRIAREPGRRRVGGVAAATVIAATLAAGAAAYQWWPRGAPVVPPVAGPIAPVMVAIDLQPWARVRIVGQDGVAAPSEEFATPFTVLLQPGRYVLKCENGGLTQALDLPIEVKSGEPQTLSRRMLGFDPERLVTTLMGKPK